MKQIDLTWTDSPPSRKRQRVACTTDNDSDGIVVMRDFADSDVEDIRAEDFKKAIFARPGPTESSLSDAHSPGKAKDKNEEDDVQVTAVLGEVATQSMPHPRSDCGVHKFVSCRDVANVKYCSRCYCYVCDTKASECEFWGTGERKHDHANAMPSKQWDKLRVLLRESGRDAAYPQLLLAFTQGTRRSTRLSGASTQARSPQSHGASRRKTGARS